MNIIIIKVRILYWHLSEPLLEVNFILEQATKAKRGSTLSLTLALDGVGGQRHARPLLPLYQLYRRLGGPQGRSGRVRKISPHPPNRDFFLFEPIAPHSTYKQLNEWPAIKWVVCHILPVFRTAYCNLRASSRHNTVHGCGIITYRLRPCATPSISVTVTPQSYFEPGRSTQIMPTTTYLAQGVGNTYNPYTLDSIPGPSSP